MRQCYFSCAVHVAPFTAASVAQGVGQKLSKAAMGGAGRPSFAQKKKLTPAIPVRQFTPRFGIEVPALDICM